MALETAIRDSDNNDHVWLAHEDTFDVLTLPDAADTAVLRGVATAIPMRKFARLAGNRLTAESVELN